MIFSSQESLKQMKGDGDEKLSTKRHINNTAMKVGGSSLLCKSNQV